MSEPQTAMAYRLICDFARGPAGDLQGLTPAELRRAWRARHGGVPSRRAYALLSEDLLVELLPARRCEVTGVHMRAYVPSSERASSC